MAAACCSAVAGVSANLTPPAFMRPPVSTCDLRTTGPPISAVASRASAAVFATLPLQQGNPVAREQGLRFVLVEPHGISSGGRSRRRAAPAAAGSSRRTPCRSFDRGSRPGPCAAAGGGGAKRDSLYSSCRSDAMWNTMSSPMKSARASGPIGWLAPFIIAVSMSPIEPSAALEAADRVDDVGHEESVHDVAGRVPHHDRGLAELLGERDAGVDRLLRGAQRGRDLDQLHGVHGVEEVQPDETFRPPGRRRRSRRRSAWRCWSRRSRSSFTTSSRRAEVVALHGQLLDDRLDHEVDVGEVVEVGGPAEALEQRAVVGGGELALLDVLLELLLDLAALGVERSRAWPWP